jgi:hypothetical protein
VIRACRKAAIPNQLGLIFRGSRQQALRTAFDETMTDAAFQADGKKSIYTQLLSGNGIDKLRASTRPRAT